MKDPDFADALSELLKLRAEVARLRAVVDEVRKLANGAVPQWAPELRAALAVLSDDTKEDGR